MKTPANCPQCGQAIARGVAGLCASCLAETAFLWNEEEDAAPGTLTNDAPDRRLGDYELIEEIGRGGMGTVWRARQLGLGREVALKVLPSGPLADAEFLARFREEARLAARLRHPNIVAVHEVGEAGGHAFFSMDLVPGPTLARRVRADGPMNPRAAAACLEQIARAMRHAHETGVLHRDLKPSNILLEADGVPRVADFGLAKAIAESAASDVASDLTLTHAVLGTPHFIAPEQAHGGGAEIGPRTDVHGLGAVLYFVLTARPPFAGESVSAVLDEARHREPPAPRLLAPGLPRDLETICLKCLEKSPARRYDSAGEVADDLRRFLDGEPVRARPPSSAYHAGKFLRRHRVLVLAAVAVGLSLVAGMIGTTKMALEARRNASEATANAVRATDSERRARASEAEALALAERARRDEERALASEAESRRAQSMGDLRTAAGHFDDGRGVDGLMHLARAVRSDPDNGIATTRLLSELAGTDFARPVRAEIDLPEFIRDLRFSPDSRLLVAACQEQIFGLGTVMVFDAVSGEDITPDSIRAVRASCAAFSPSGQWLALALDYRIVLFDPVTGASGREFPFNAIALSCTWSPDGSLLSATGGPLDAGITRVWRGESGEPFFSLDDTAPVEPVCWSADGRRFAVNGPGKQVTVYEAATGAAIRAFSPHDDSHRLHAQGFTRDAGGIAVLETSGPLRLFDIASGQTAGDPFAPDPGMSSGGRLAPDGGMLVLTGMLSGAARVWDLDLRRPVPAPSFSGKFFSNVAFAPDGGMAVLPSSRGDAAAVFIDLDSGSFSRAALRLPGGAVVVAVSPDGRRVACGGRSRKLGLYDLRSRAARPLVLPRQENQWQVAFSDDGASLIAMGEEGRTTMWNAATGASERGVADDRDVARLELREGLRGHTALPWMGAEFPSGGVGPMHRWLPEAMVHGTVLAAAQSPDGRLVATGGRDHTLRLWNRADATPARPDVPVPRSVAALAFDLAGARLAAGLTDGVVMSFELPEMGPTGRSAALTGAVRALSWQPADSEAKPGPACVACGGASGVSLFFPGQGRTLRLEGPVDEVRQLAWNGDGSRLAAGTASGAAWLWDRRGRTIAGPLRHLSGPHYSGLLVRFSPDGKWLATGGAHDGAVRLWSAENGLAHAVLPTGSLAADLAFDPSGTRLAVVSDGIVVWDPRTAQPLTSRRELPDGQIPVAIAWNPDGTRLAAVSRGRAVFVFDLPPQVPRAPGWLAGFAESFAGWRLDAQGLPQLVPEAERRTILEAAALGGETEDAAARWCAWVQRDPDHGEGGASPYSARPLSGHLADLERLNTVDALFNLNRIAPTRARHLAAKAWRHSTANLGRSADANPKLAARLPFEALASGSTDKAAESAAAFVLAMDGDPAATWPVLLGRAERAGGEPDPWDNLAILLERGAHWPGVSATAHEAARLSAAAGDGLVAAWYERLATDAHARATAMAPASFTCEPPLDPAGLIRFWRLARENPAAAAAEAFRLVAAEPRNIFTWHLLTDALESLATADPSSDRWRSAVDVIARACRRKRDPETESTSDSPAVIESLELSAPARDALTELSAPNQ